MTIVRVNWGDEVQQERDADRSTALCRHNAALVRKSVIIHTSPKLEDVLSRSHPDSGSVHSFFPFL